MARATYWYWVLLLALLPLAWSTFHNDQEDTARRLQQTLDDHPDVQEQLDDLKAISAEEGYPDVPMSRQATWAARLAPDHRLSGALFAYDTWAHWLLALLSGAAFLGLTLVIFPAHHARARDLILAGLFTGTVGIFLLLGLQWVAFHYDGFVISGGTFLIVEVLLKWIGFSYSAALGDTNIVISAIGFTCGVGLCEEICKAIPLIFCSRQGWMNSWRGACMLGLASGAGFGVSEAITYSSDSYNGIDAGGIYLVRFISCVALHAMWTASVALTLYRRQDLFDGSLSLLDWVARLIRTTGVAIILHGLYDTLLKKNLDGAALLVALASFGYLAYLIERSRRDLPDDEPAPALP